MSVSLSLSFKSSSLLTAACLLPSNYYRHDRLPWQWKLHTAIQSKQSLHRVGSCHSRLKLTDSRRPVSQSTLNGTIQDSSHQLSPKQPGNPWATATAKVKPSGPSVKKQVKQVRKYTQPCINSTNRLITDRSIIVNIANCESWCFDECLYDHIMICHCVPIMPNMPMPSRSTHCSLSVTASLGD